MSMWTAIFLIVFVGVAFEAFRLWVTNQPRKKRPMDTELLKKLEAMENRLANLETIVIKKQNEDKWEALKD